METLDLLSDKKWIPKLFLFAGQIRSFFFFLIYHLSEIILFPMQSIDKMEKKQKQNLIFLV